MQGQPLLKYLLNEFAHAASTSAATHLFAIYATLPVSDFTLRLHEKFGFGWDNSLLADIVSIRIYILAHLLL